MATIKEIAEKVGVSNATVSRVLNYDDGISVNQETKDKIFAVAEELGYKKKVVNPKIEKVAFLYWVYHEEELEDIYYQAIHVELLKAAKLRNIELQVITKEQGFSSIGKDINAFIAIGWFNRKEIDYLYKITPNGIFIDTSPDEKLFDSVRPNLDSIVTQIVDYFHEKGYETMGFVGGMDRNIDTSKPSMDVREWSFRESAKYYESLNEDYIFITEKYSVEAGFKVGKKIVESGKIPRSLCVASDTLAVGILQALNEGNIQIPEQIAVFSINNVNVAQYVSPPLSTFHVDVPLMCEAALDMLQERILKGRKITKTVFVNGTPVYRKSC